MCLGLPCLSLVSLLPIAVADVFFVLIFCFLLKPSLAGYWKGCGTAACTFSCLAFHALQHSNLDICFPVHCSNTSNPNCSLKSFDFFIGVIANSWNCKLTRSLVVKERVPDFAAMCLFQVREHFYLETSRNSDVTVQDMQQILNNIYVRGLRHLKAPTVIPGNSMLLHWLLCFSFRCFPCFKILISYCCYQNDIKSSSPKPAFLTT